MTRAQLEQILTNETLVDRIVWAESRDAVRAAILDALAPLLIGTCSTCRHYRRSGRWYDRCREGWSDCGDPDFACNRWAARDTATEGQ